MATTIKKFPSFKKGDTPTFWFRFTLPTGLTSWSGINYDISITAADAPTTNDNAIAYRTGQVLSIDAQNRATASITPTRQESRNFVAGDTLYHVEPQLVQNGVYVSTPITGTFTVEQDYVV